MATFCVHMRIANVIVRTCTNAILVNMWTSWIAANNVQTPYTYFQKMSQSCLPNPQGPLSKQLPLSCIESANNHVEEMAKHMTAEDTKDREREARISLV